jgi:mannosyl-oligosaccharide glucosidase
VFGSNLGNVLQAGVLGDANFWAFQKSWEGKGGWDVKYESGEFDEEESRAIEEGDKEGKDPEITDALSKLARAYAAHFTSSLALPPPSSSSPYSSPAYHAFAQEVTSNLLGGIGYFHGKSLIDRTFAHEYDEAPEEVEEGEDGVRETGEMELLTATPSRSFFPRGFYWDEGFHLQIVGELDNDLSLEILKSWIDLIDEDGWVGREQILGEEARSKVRLSSCSSRRDESILPLTLRSLSSLFFYSGPLRVSSPVPDLRQPPDADYGRHLPHQPSQRSPGNRPS